jgi:NAD(P)-dependent dehydrogenase (short-subunit alcohol dehydrogenase family)
MDFQNKIALVTGGANGIGLAAAEAFAEQGAKIVLVDRDSEAGAAAADGIRRQGGEARFVAADVTRSADVQAYVRSTLDAFGRIDCFFNNAGIEGAIAPTAEYDEAMFDAVVAVNLKGVFLGLRHVLPVMLKQRSGAVVNTASTAGVVGTPRMPAYTASKHAIIGLTKTAAAEVGPYGIRVNALCPGATDTRMIHSIESQINSGDPEGVGRAYRLAIPIGRYVSAREIAEIALFLCSDRASAITGGVYMADGGRTSVSASITAAR